MLPVIFCGKSSEQICTVIKELFEKSVTVSVIKSRSAVFFRDSCLLFICSDEREYKFFDKAVVIATDCGEVYGNIRLLKGGYLIAESLNKSALTYAEDNKLIPIEFGPSHFATVTFSSVQSDCTVVSFKRCIKDINGDTVEPFEIPIFLEEKNNFAAYIAAALLAVIGLSETQEKL